MARTMKTGGKKTLGRTKTKAKGKQAVTTTPQKGKGDQHQRTSGYNYYSNCIEYEATLGAIWTLEGHVQQDPPSPEKQDLLGKLQKVREDFIATLQDVSKQVTIAFEVADGRLKWCIKDHAAKRGCKYCVMSLVESQGH